MNQYEQNFKYATHKMPFFTAATVEVAGISHHICVAGPSATAMAENYGAAIDALTTAYAVRSERTVIDATQLLTLLQCGIDKARKHGDMDRMVRLVKAAALVQSGAVAVSEEGMQVTSQRDAGRRYHVTPALSCNCEDWLRHAETPDKYYCKHGLAVMMMSKLTTGA